MRDFNNRITDSYHPDILHWIEEYFAHNNKDESILKQIFVSMGKVLIPRFQNMLNTDVITADDIYNETWFAIIDPETPEYDINKGSFIGYFVFIAKNKIKNWNFRKENTSNVKIEDIKFEILDKIEPNRDLFNNELKLQFYKSVNRLSNFQREIIIFRKLGFKFSEISKIFNVNEDVLRQRMVSAKKSFKSDPDITEILDLLEER